MDLYYDNNIFASNLKKQLELKNMTGADLAKLLDCSKSIITDWLKGRKLPRMNKVEKMCEIFHCSREELISEPKGAEVPEAVPVQITGFIPVYGEIPAGVPVFEDNRIIDYISTTYAHPEEYFGLKVKGNSMINAGIQNGSYVTIHKQNFAENGNIVACRLNCDEVTLKRFNQQGDSVILMPENPEYSPILINAKDFTEGCAQIIGVATDVTIKL